jgi:hypothetical protein
MWEKQIEARRSVTVAATPEQAWPLLSGPAAWCLYPGTSFAFDVAASPTGSGHLFLWISGSADGSGADVFEVCDEVQGEKISVQARGSLPAGRRVVTLSVAPDGRGVKVGAAVRTYAQREVVVDAELMWSRQLSQWLEDLRAVLDNQAPQPGAGMPVAAQQAIAEVPSPKDPFMVETTVTISAPSTMVWQAVRSGEAGRLAAQAAYSGHIPGTPRQQLGALSYAIVRQPDGRLPAALTRVCEINEGTSVTWRRAGLPHDELRCVLRPEGSTTQLKLNLWWPQLPTSATREHMTSVMTEHLRTRAQRYKARIE